MSEQHPRRSGIQRRGVPPRRQRGATAVIIAVVLLVLVPLLALSIEVGRLYYAQRQLEKLATIAALDGARAGSGCARNTATGVAGSGVPGTLAATAAEVTASLARNPTGLTLVSNAAIPQVELGYYATNAGRRIFTPDASDPNRVDAVRVNLVASKPSLLFSIPGFSSAGLLYASATAQQAARGSFYLGTTVASLSGGLANQLLSGLLCVAGDTTCQNSVIALNAISATSGLASVNVNASQLATAAGISVKDLSNPLAIGTATPVLKDLLNGLATQLSGTASSQVTGLLQQLASASTNPSPTPLGTIFGAVDQTAANVPFVNLLDLVLALGEAANADPTGAKSIKLPISLDFPDSSPVATGSVFVKILEPPQFSGLGRPGSTTAHTSQVAVLVRIAVLDTLLTTINKLFDPLRLLGVNVALAPNINIGVDVAVAQSTAQLDRLQCPIPGVNGGYPIASLSAAPSIANVAVGTFTGNPASAPALAPAETIKILSVNGTPVLSIRLNADVGGGGGPQTLPSDVTQFDRITQLANGSPLPAGMQPYYLAYGAPGSTKTSVSNPQTVGSNPAVQLKATFISDPDKAGLPALLTSSLKTLLDSVMSLLQPLLTGINGLTTNRVTPLLNTLGIQLGAATVTMDTVQIAPPQLITTCLRGDTTPNCVGTP